MIDWEETLKDTREKAKRARELLQPPMGSDVAILRRKINRSAGGLIIPSQKEDELGIAEGCIIAISREIVWAWGRDLQLTADGVRRLEADPSQWPVGPDHWVSYYTTGAYRCEMFEDLPIDIVNFNLLKIRWRTKAYAQELKDRDAKAQRAREIEEEAARKLEQAREESKAT